MKSLSTSSLTFSSISNGSAPCLLSFKINLSIALFFSAPAKRNSEIALLPSSDNPMFGVILSTKSILSLSENAPFNFSPRVSASCAPIDLNSCGPAISPTGIPRSAPNSLKGKIRFSNLPVFTPELIRVCSLFICGIVEAAD